MRKGWEIKQLGEICNVYNGSTPLRSKKEFWESGKINWFTVEDIRHQGRIISSTKQKISSLGFEKSSLKLLPPKSILLCCTASVGEYAMNTVELTTNQQFNGIVVKNKDYLLPEYLFYFSSTLKKILLEKSGKTTIDFVSMKKVKSIKIPIPPLDEQKRIVAKLDECFEAIDKARANVEKNLNNAKELFQSKLNEIFSQKGDGWVEKRLGEVCIVERGSSPRPIKDYLTESEDGVNWIKIGDTKNVGKYIYTTKQKITKEGAKRSRFVDVGDFILTNSMTYGKPYIMKTKGYIHDGWFVLRLSNQINSEFFWYLLASPYTMEQFEYLAAGAIVKNISGDLVKKAILPIPPIGEQATIVERMDTLSSQTQSLESNYQQELDALDELKKSILDKAFNGEL